MLPKNDERYFGNAMLPKPSRPTVSQDRTYTHGRIVSAESAKLTPSRSAMNPEHYDTAFPSEPLGPNGEKSYYILRFELSQLSSE